MREKRRVRRGWIKVHAMIDIETDHILGLEVADEPVQDDLCLPRILIRQLRIVGKNILYARFAVVEDMTGSMSSTPWKNEESNQEPRHGRMLLQDPPDQPKRAECIGERVKNGGYREWADITKSGMKWKIDGVFLP